MRVLHVLASNKYSGAENVACQIIKMFDGRFDMAYCSPEGPIKNTLSKKNIKYYSIEKLNKNCLKKIIDQYNPDIIHAHDVKASIVASKFKSKCKIVSHIHGNDKKKMGKITLKSLLYNFVSRHLDNIIMVSKSCFDDYIFKNKIKDKVYVLYNIINCNEIQQKVRHQEDCCNFDVCYLGRLEEVKNPLRILEIMKDLIKANNKIKCAIVGDGLLMPDCKNFIQINELDDNIRLYGFMDNPYTVLRNSRVLLMGSINEGTPMCVLESLCLGVPVVSTKTDGIVDIIDQGYNGYLYESNAEAATFLERIIDDDNHFEKMRENCINFSESFNDIEKYKKTLELIYKL